VIILATVDFDEYVYQALCAGAIGFLVKASAAPGSPRASAPPSGGNAVLAPIVTCRLIETYTRRGEGSSRLAADTCPYANTRYGSRWPTACPTSK
jgi:hypothetical protein